MAWGKDGSGAEDKFGENWGQGPFASFTVWKSQRSLLDRDPFTNMDGSAK